MNYKEFLHFLFDGLTGYIEFREMVGGKKPKPKFVPVHKIEEYTPDLNKNVYFGTYVRKTNTRGDKTNCGVTNVLWLDFDNKNDFELNEFKSMVDYAISSNGIPSATIEIQSGNGFHYYWKLNKHTSETENILKIMSRLVDSDKNVVDKARIMRLPDTYNMKYGQPRKCRILKIRKDNIFDISLFKKVLKMDDVPVYETEIPCLNKIMSGVDRGERNFWLLRLIDDLQNKDYDYQSANKICYAWNKRNNPSLDNVEFKNNFSLNWNNLKRGEYYVTCNPSKDEFKENLNVYCDWDSCPHKTLGKGGFEYLDKGIKLNKKFIEDMREWSGKELLALSWLRVGFQQYGNDKYFSAKEIKEGIGSSKPTVLSILKKKHFLCCVDIIKKGRTTYYKYKHNGAFGKGYALLNVKSMYDCIKGIITPTAFKIYVVLCCYTEKYRTTYISYQSIAEKIGVKKSNINKYIAELEDTNWIIRDKRFHKGSKIFNYVYRVL